MISLHTHCSSLPAVLDGPGGGGGSVLEVYMSKHVKEILNFTTYIYIIHHDDRACINVKTKIQHSCQTQYSMNIHVCGILDYQE